MLGAAGLALIALSVPLTILTRDPQASRNGLGPAFALVCVLLGALIASRQARNPEGWILLSLALCLIALIDAGLYAVLDYHLHHGLLPLGEPAVFLKDTLGEMLIFVLALIIVLFPDGRLTRRWKWVLWSYVLLIAVITVGIFANEAGTISGRPIRVDMTGGYSGPGGPTGILAVLATIAGFGWVLIVLFWPAFVARQVIAWRRSTGERRQQLKWLMGGAIISVAGLMVVAFGPSIDQTSGQVLRDLALVALAALPVSIGIGILKYRLYDIDRLISRTVSYALLTGLLIGVYIAMITLATRVLPVRGPVAVAASTLVAAALFNPLRRRVQHSVDRRFNRTRYDAEATVAAFAERLQGTVELEATRQEMLMAISLTLEPSHASVWQPPDVSQ